MGFERQQLGRDSRDEQPAGLDVLAGAAQEGGAALGPTQDLDRLHGNGDKREAPAEMEVSGVGLDDVDWEVAGTEPQLGQKLGIVIQRRYLVPAPREVEGDATRSRPDVEDGIAHFSGQFAPQREVRRVPGTLHVVPDDRLRRGHAGAITRSARWRVVTVAGSSAIGSPSAYIVKGRSAEIRTSRARTTCTDGES